MWCCKLAQCEACRSQHGCGEMRELEVPEGGAQSRERFELLLTPTAVFSRHLQTYPPSAGPVPRRRSVVSAAINAAGDAQRRIS